MTFGDNSVTVRKATLDDLDVIKQLADAHRHELGFVMRPALKRSIDRGELFVAIGDNRLAGFVEYHHRRDRQTTLYHIAVSNEMRHRGIGRRLIEALSKEARADGKAFIRLKCPRALAANTFYSRLGWEQVAVEKGKARSLAVWELSLAE